MHHFSWDIVTPSSTSFFTEPPGGCSSTRSDSIDSTDSVGSGYLMDTSLCPWSTVVEESDAPSPYKERRSLEKNRRKSTQAILLSLLKRVDMDHLRWFLLGALVCLVSILLSPGQSTSQGIVHHAEVTPISTGRSHSEVVVIVPTDRPGNENALFKRMVSPTVLTEVVVIVAIQSLGLPAMARLSLLLRRGIPTLMNWMALLVRTLRRVPLLRSGSSLTAVVASSTQSLRTGLARIVTQGWKQTLHLYKQTAASKAFNRGKKFLKHFFPVHHDDDEEEEVHD
jgi:hypothetical protein